MPVTTKIVEDGKVAKMGLDAGESRKRGKRSLERQLAYQFDAIGIFCQICLESTAFATRQCKVSLSTGRCYDQVAAADSSVQWRNGALVRE